MTTEILVAAIISLATYVGSEHSIVEPIIGKSAQQATSEPTSVIMKDGKLWVTKEGKNELLETELKLGTSIVKPDGTVFLESGQIVILKEGDQVTADGKVITVALLPGDPGEPK
jgi:hypothetical protein